jgi:hypothetical protein
MVNSVLNLQSEYSLAVTGVEKSENTINGGFEHSNEEDLGYKLSLSDENWKLLGNKGKNEDDKDNDEFSEEDLKKIEELKKIDKKVHIHEEAHLSAAGGYARGGANYDYVEGPDGKRYANGGHVNLDTGKEKTPEATIRKANVIQKAALAPADPSPADRQIAAGATKMAADAQKEIAERNMHEGTKTPQKETKPPQESSNAGQATVSEAN